MNMGFIVKLLVTILLVAQIVWGQPENDSDFEVGSVVFVATVKFALILAIWMYL